MVALVAVVILGGAYLLNPSYTRRLLGASEGFTDAVDAPTLSEASNYKMNEASMNVAGATQEEEEKKNQNVASDTPAAPTAGAEGYADLSDFEGPSQFGNAEAPAGCYPRDQLTPSELLPKDPNSVWAQQNPMGTGSLKGKNFLSAGALIGVNTVGQSLRNANYQLRSEPPNPQVPISVFNQTTIEPDVNRRTLEIA
jgi:hypothetical protein